MPRSPLSSETTIMQLRHLLPLFLLASAASAQQQVTLQGKVEDASPSGFLVACTDTRLESSAFNLNLFLGENVQITGTRVQTTGTPLVNVTGIQIVPEIFEIPGNPEVGQDIRFGATYTPGSQAIFFAALAPGFTPVRSMGTLLIDAPGRVRMGSAVIPPVGNVEITVPMPNDPSLVGLTVYAQTVLRTGSTFLLSNPDCKDIQ